MRFRNVAIATPQVQNALRRSWATLQRKTANDELDESTAVVPWDTALKGTTEMTPEAYGPLKAECERRVRRIYGEGAMIIRPGLIIGRYDPTGRFSYWPQRLRKGGRIVVMDRLDAPVQFIDAFDLAEWTLDLCYRRHSGVLNATGPLQAITFGDLIDKLMYLAPKGSKIVALNDQQLLERNVAPWVGLPLWLPAQENEDGIMKARLDVPIAAGLKIRPFVDTIDDILDEIDDTGFAAGASLTEEQEQTLLDSL